MLGRMSLTSTFNCVIGFGKSTPEIAALIRHREYGMDEFYNLTMLCIKHLEILSLLLETRLDWVIQAIVHLYIFMTLFARIIILSSRPSEVPLVKTTTKKASLWWVNDNIFWLLLTCPWQYECKYEIINQGCSCMFCARPVSPKWCGST